MTKFRAVAYLGLGGSGWTELKKANWDKCDMKLLLTSGGISNRSIRNALVDLLGKAIAESTALFVPTAIYAMSIGPEIAARMILGTTPTPMCELGWKSLGVLELTALPSIKEENWVPKLQETDVLLVGGGDCQYLC
jgi:dipeptidase E